MARIRTIKPEFWSDSKTGTLSDKATKLFIGLLNFCDDYGVIQFDIAEFTAKIFPFENFRDCSRVLAQAICDEILPKGLASIFSVNFDHEDESNNFLWVKNFERHQRVDRPGKPLLPGWESGDNPKYYAKKNNFEYSALGINNEGEISEFREYSRVVANIRPGKERNSKGKDNNPPTPLSGVANAPKPSRRKASVMTKTQEGLFDRFWEAYPRKLSKGQAEKAWLSIKPDEQLLATMIEAIERTKEHEDWQREGGKFIPYPATWLNAKRWLDEHKPVDLNFNPNAQTRIEMFQMAKMILECDGAQNFESYCLTKKLSPKGVMEWISSNSDRL